MNRTSILAGIILLLTGSICHAQQPLSKSFELRYYTPDPKADGETDFKGETEYFDTDQRVEYLETYEKYARQYFINPNWDQIVVRDEEAKEIASSIKPQPLPVERNRLLLKDWKCLGFKDGLHEQRMEALEKWNAYKNLTIEDESLLFEKAAEFSVPIPAQDWRSLFKLNVHIPVRGSFTLNIGEAIRVTQDEIPSGRWTSLEIDLDLENGRYNLMVDGKKTVDFEPVRSTVPITSLRIDAGKGVRIDDLHAVQYTRGNFTEDKNSRDVPYLINTILFENFKAKPKINGWQTTDYDDSLWEIRKIPYPHGGDRFRDESLYMRKKIYVPDFKVAEFNLETIDPGGEVWINGEVVHVQHNRYPVSIDISRYLEPGKENLLAVRVFPNKVIHTNRHTAADLYTGAFAGRGWIDFRDDRFIDDIFLHTASIDGDGAILRFQAELRNDDWQIEEREMKTTREFNGKMEVAIFKWFPVEEEVPVTKQTYPVSIRLHHDLKIEKDIEIEQADLWTFKDPNLYKVVCTLMDESGRELDDLVVTTGIRTISQEGGTFRINGEPEMMNGALLFAYKYPLEDIARTVRCGEEFWLVKEIEMIRRMNANTIRMSIHHGLMGGINDPRMAEIGDQLGVMFQWTTSTWVRTGSPWDLDFEGLPKYIKQVRNHPSIIMWQVGNHPKFKGYEIDGLEFYTQVYNSIFPIDPSRFIVPVGNHSRLGRGIPNDAGTLNLRGDTLIDKTVWTAPMITRGNFDHATSYGTNWTTLRRYPYPRNFSGDMGWRETGFRTDYLNSPERAYFDYESEESAGQPNWELRKGKPSYRIKSYELLYDEGSIGRQLSVDEWRLSQAWQAFSAYEAYRKKRWLDYDGQAWCTLHGGGNTATYQKPLIDYYGHSKMAFHTVKMVFQPVLVGSKNVDLVYGPEDAIPIVIMNLGEAKIVELKVSIKSPDGAIVYSEVFPDIRLKAGRSFTDIGPWKPEFRKEGYYVFEYELISGTP